MARYLNNQKYQRRYLGNTKLKKKYLGETNVWSGGSVVSYYNGTTLLGTREVDEGADVLHDTGFTPTKTNYTFIGWGSEPNGTRFETLVATGEAMLLYAVFTPNELTIVSADTYGFNITVNSDYVSGSVIASGNGTPYIAGGASWNETSTFTFDMGSIYQGNNLTVAARATYNGSGDSDAPIVNTSRFDSTNIGRNSTVTLTNIVEGSHTLTAIGNTTSAPLTQRHAVFVASLVLTNPTQWV